MSAQVFKPRVVEKQEWVQAVNPADRELLTSFAGLAPDDWHPPAVRFIRDDGPNFHNIRPSDIPWLGSNTMVFRDHAYEQVREIFRPWGQFLELEVEDQSDRLWLFNVLTVRDALDERMSTIDYFDDGVRIMLLHKWEFHSDRVDDPMVFRIPKVSDLLLTGEVVSAIQELNLSGAHFKLVWSDDD